MNKDYPLVSVNIIEYNTEPSFFIDAVISMLNQDYPNYEIIIVIDSCLVDLTQYPFNDNRIKIIKNDKREGISKSRNIALDNSKGKYIAVMDTDDISEPNRLTEQVKFMENNPQVVACGTWFNFFGNKTGVRKRVIDDNEYYRCCLFFGNNPTIIHPSSMIRKSTLDENTIRYDETIIAGEDYDLWIKLSDLGIVTNLKKVLFNYRDRDNQMSKQNTVSDVKRQSHYVIIDRLFNNIGFVGNDDYKHYIFDKYDKKIKLKQYYLFLDSLIESNKNSNYYLDDKFESVINENWISKIYHTNFFSVFLSLITLPPRQKIFVIKTEIKRICNKKRTK